MNASSAPAGRRRRWSSSIQARLLLVVVGVTLPLIALSAYLGWQAVEAQRVQIRREAVEEVRERAADLESIVQAWNQTLGALAATPAIRDKHLDEANAIFEDLVRTYPYLINVAVVDRDFKIWASAVPQIRGVTVSGASRDRLQELLQSGRAGVSDPVSLPAGPGGSQRSLVFIWQPVHDAGGQVVGLLQIGLPLDTLHTALRLETMAPGRPVLIVHVNGTVLTASEDRAAWVGRDINDTPLGRGMRGNQGLVEYVDDNGVGQFAAFQKATTLPWYAVVSLSSAEAYAPLRPMAAGTMFSVAAVALLALLLGRLLSAEVTRPVRRLVEAAGRLSTGDLAYRVPAEEGELGQVGAAFNQMAGDLERSYRDLEQRVQERTAELAEAQRELEALNADLQQRVEVQVGQLEQASQLKRYLSPRLAEHLLEGQGGMDRRTTRRNLTVLFADIRGFTSFSEEVEPEELIDLLNDVLTLMTTVVFEFDGTLDKYLGDGLMAFFGDPVAYDDHAERAVRSALAMRDRLAGLQGRWFATGQAPLGVGIGIATGYVTVGTIGAPNRLEYTVIGNNVNLASRLADQAAGGEILVNAKALAAVGPLVHARSRGRVEVQGRKRPVQVAEILSLRADDSGAEAAAPLDLAEASRTRRRAGPR